MTLITISITAKTGLGVIGLNMKVLSVILSFYLLGCMASNSAPDHRLNSETGWPAQIKPDEVENYVPWSQAIDILLEIPEKVEAVGQGHNLGVSIIFKDRTYLGTIEPDIDAIFGVLQDCGKRCEHILWITE